MVLNVTEVSQKIKKLNWLSIKKNIIQLEKMPHYNYKGV